MASKKQQPRRRTGPTTAPGRRKSCHFCRDKVAEIDYKNIAQLRRYISEKEDSLARIPAPAGATRSRWRRRSSGRGDGSPPVRRLDREP